jgi:branched-chain amino acid transport system permease protein
MSRTSRIGLLVLVVVLATLPMVLPNAYYVDVAIRMCINAIVVLSLNMLIGFAGQISLGHAGFLGIGAYASAVLPTQFGWPPIAALAAGAALSGLLAVLVARPIFALRGHYLAMATLGLGIILAMIFRNETALTGGPDGIPVPSLGLFGYELKSEMQWYWLIAALLVVSVWATLNLVDSPFGRALRALHGSEVASQAVGVNIWRYKVAVFVLSAVGASVMGSVTAHYVGFVTPNIADFFHSIELVTMVVVGGMASVFGSLVGAVLLTGLPQALARFEGWETVVFGAILMLTMIFLPKGLVPTLAARLRRNA